MISNRRVFTDDHLPNNLLHREGAVEQLSLALEPISDGEPAHDVLISGASGVGKTALARHSLEQLQRETHADLMTAHVRSLGQSTAGILRRVLDECSRYHGSLPGNQSAATLQDELADAVSAPYVVVLDEADGLPETDALELLAKTPLVSTIAICHDHDAFLAQTESHTPDPRLIELSRYGVSELADILQARADVGLRNHPVSREQLEHIADEVAGVARRGIQSLRAAAEIASERDHGEITDGDIRDSYRRARRRIRASNLASLPYHHHVLYEIVRSGDAGQLSAGDVHDHYEAIAERVYEGRGQTPLTTRRARRNKLAKLRAYDLVGVDGDGRARGYWVVDETIDSPMDIDIDVAVAE